jgi:hypothetical protein
MSIYPKIVSSVVDHMYECGLIEIISTKPKTDNCESAAKTRFSFNHMPLPPIDLNGEKSFDDWMRKYYEGVPLEVEIKTALFSAKKKDENQVFIAAHIPATKNLASNSIIKSEIKNELGIEIVGDLDKNTALAKINGILKPFFDDCRICDQQALNELNEFLKNAPTDSTIFSNIQPLKAKIEKPELDFGELNPWTLTSLTLDSKNDYWKSKGIQAFDIIHLVDIDLIKRTGISTTNAGSRHISMTLSNTHNAFQYMASVLNQIYENENIEKLPLVFSSNLEKQQQI